MTAGLPGTGIGGLYYLLLVACMPARELWRTLRGRSSRERWREVFRHVALAAGIVATLSIAAWTLAHGLFAGAERGWINAQDLHVALAAGSAWSRRAAFASFGVLAFLIVAAALLRRLVGQPSRGRGRHPHDPARRGPAGVTGAPRPVRAPRPVLVSEFRGAAPSLADGEA